MSSLNLVLVVQAIEVWWTKEARGEPLATPRNRLPEIFELPFKSFPPKPATPGYIRHDLSWGEANEFQKPLSEKVEVLEFSGEIKNRLLNFRLVGDSMKVGFERSYGARPQGNVLFNYTRLGAPARTVPLEIFTLQAGEWGQVRYNGRFSWNTAWKYEKWVYNIGLFQPPVSAGCFQGSPARAYSNLADLW